MNKLAKQMLTSHLKKKSLVVIEPEDYLDFFEPDDVYCVYPVEGGRVINDRIECYFVQLSDWGTNGIRAIYSDPSAGSAACDLLDLFRELEINEFRLEMKITTPNTIGVLKKYFEK